MNLIGTQSLTIVAVLGALLSGVPGPTAAAAPKAVVVSSPTIAREGTATLSPADRLSSGRLRSSIRVSSGKRLRVDVNPPLPGGRNWKVRIERSRNGKWRQVCTCRTVGRAETLSLKVPKGTYRIRVLPHKGYRTSTPAQRFSSIPP